jgi:hypothetical protein
MTNSLRCHRRFSAAIVSLSLLAGCQSLGLNLPGLNNRPPQASTKNPVTEVLCLWEPAEGTGLDKLPARGFAGQILFLTPRGAGEPVQVDGKVKIYVFDDCGSIKEQQQPIHQFAFDATAWNAFLRKTNVGAAYQVFLPYTRPGMHQAVCSLRVCYEAADGQPIYSKFAKVTLAGTPRPAADDEPAPSADSVVVAQPERGARAPTEPAKAVVPAAYTFEDSKASQASIRQLQARFDELLDSNAGTAAVGLPTESGDDAPPARIRLKPILADE